MTIAAAEPTNRVRRLQHSVVPCAIVALSVRSCRPYTFLDRLLSDEDGAPRAHIQARGTGPTPQIRFIPCSALLPCTSSEQRELTVRGEGGVAIMRSIVRFWVIRNRLRARARESPDTYRGLRLFRVFLALIDRIYL